MTTNNTLGSGNGHLESGWYTVDVDGVSVAYEVRGSGPVVVAHSGGPGASAASLRMPDVERSATVVYLDPVGTGRSGRIPDGDYSTAAYARIAAAVIATMPGGRAVFLGHSHGGMVALQLALDHPGVLDGVIVYDGRATNVGLIAEATARVDAFVRRFPDDPAAAEARRAWDDARAQEESDPALRSAATAASIATRLRPAYLADFRAQPDVLQQLHEDSEYFVDPNRQPGASWDVRPRLPEIRVPVSVFVGKHDFICGPAAAVEIWQDVPGAELVTFAASGHFAHREEPEAFAAAVHRFMAEVGTAGV